MYVLTGIATSSTSSLGFTRVVTRATEAFRYQMIAATQVLRKIQEFRMVAEFLQDIDSLERLRFRTAKQSLDLRRRNEEAVKLELEV